MRSAVGERNTHIHKAFVLLAKMCILIVKSISERLFVLSDPQITLSSLHGWRYPTFLLNSLASATTVGVHWRDVFPAYQMLPIKLFFCRLRISSLLPPSRRGVFIYDKEYGQLMACSRTICMDKKYYLPPAGSHVYVYPYFAHPTFYLNQLS